MKGKIKSTTQAQGITLNGTDGGEASWSVSTAGDFDGDGRQDWLIGAPAAATAYIVLSGELAGGDTVQLGNLGQQGIILNGAAGSDAGWSVSTAGDFDGDGKQDWLVGAPQSNSRLGQAYVVFSGGLAEGDTVQLDNLGKQGITLNGTTLSFAGYSVSPAGDFDGDGKQDWLVGAYFTNFEAGQVYVVFSGGLAGGDTVQLGNLGQQGITFNGAALSSAGWSVSTAGDFDGDGKQDWLIGAPAAAKAYVVLSGGLNAGDVIHLDKLGKHGITLNDATLGLSPDSGKSVSLAGDFDGDGKQDWLIGAPSAYYDEGGKAYVVFSEGLSPGDNIHLDDLGEQGIIINGTTSSTGWSVSLAGDFDGDGKQDWLIGEPTTLHAYVVLSKGLTGGSIVNLGNLGTQGITLKGTARSMAGNAVSLAGDFDGDGKQDWLVGAPGFNDYDGQAYVVFNEGLQGGDFVNLWELANTTTSIYFSDNEAEQRTSVKEIQEVPPASSYKLDNDKDNMFESAASSMKPSFPELGSAAMLSLVLGKLVCNAVTQVYEMGKRWLQDEIKVAAPAAELKQAQVSFERLEARIDKLLSQNSSDEWYRFGLEDLKDELAAADESSISLAQVKVWQAELAELEADYAPKQAVSMSVEKQAYSNSFFKPVQQPVIPEQQAALPQAPAQGRIAV